jgi:hyaluronoglucosaminidase
MPSFTKRIQLRRGEASLWESTNPVLLAGEFGIDLTNKRVKLGDGVTTWNSLTYLGPVQTVAGRTGNIILQNDDVFGSASQVSLHSVETDLSNLRGELGDMEDYTSGLTN